MDRETNERDSDLNKAARRAEGISKNPGVVASLSEKAQKKVRENQRLFKNLRKDVDLLLRLSKAWATGKYKNVSIATILIVVGAIIYLLDPIDALPDFLPLLGLTDDVAVIGLAISRVRAELDKFEEWENEITIK